MATLKYNKLGSEGKDITKHADIEAKQMKRFLPVSMRNMNGSKNINSKKRKKRSELKANTDLLLSLS